MTREELKARYPYASSAFLDRNCDRPERLRPGDQKRAEGHALERPLPGEAKGCSRVTIRFRIFAIRPCDWDGWHIKELQDMLCHACILDSDQWDSLQGEVISEKVCKKSEERTEIEIFLP